VAGGTLFGFNAAGLIENGTIFPFMTSFEFDGPLTEAGDPNEKYHAMREVIGKVFIFEFIS